MTSNTLKGYELRVSALAAALKCAGKNDVRYYLNGVYLDFPAGRIVATDGSRLFCGAIPSADCAPVIVPRDMVEKVLKANRALPKTTRETCALIVNVTAPGNVPTVQFNHALAGAVFESAAIDVKFPDYARVIPDKVSGEPAGYNPEYLVDARDALLLYGERGRILQGVNWGFNGTGPGVFDLPGITALVVVMPLRCEVNELDLSWYKAKPMQE